MGQGLVAEREGVISMVGWNLSSHICSRSREQRLVGLVRAPVEMAEEIATVVRCVLAPVADAFEDTARHHRFTQWSIYYMWVI